MNTGTTPCLTSWQNYYGVASMTTRRIALDIETLGTQETSVVLTIGAVNIDNPDEQLEIALSVEDQIALGCTMDWPTIQFWFNQSNETRAALFEKRPVPVTSGLSLLSRFCTHDARSIPASQIEVWSYGNMDAKILEHLNSLATGGRPLIGYRDWCDGRTLARITGLRLPTPSIPHHALSDALSLATLVRKATQSINAK
jgi:hypothetical protein